MADQNASAEVQQALAAFRARNYVKASDLCHRVLQRRRHDETALMLLAEIAQAREQPAEALEYMTRAVRLSPKSPRLRERLGHHYAFYGDYGKALAQFERALKLDPDAMGAIAGSAQVLELQHKADRARRRLEPHVRRRPLDSQLLAVYLRLLVNAGDLDDAIALGSGLMGVEQPPSISRREACFQLARAYERSGDFDRAFETAVRANAMLTAPFDPEAYRRSMDGVIETFTPELLASVPRPAQPSDTPVFIVGVPRCGSTLVERIIDAHPDAFGAGELRTMLPIVGDLPMRVGSGRAYPQCVGDLEPDHVEILSREYLDAITPLAPKSRRVVNKDLGNFQYLGLINILLPAARVIHCRRHAEDTCLSCFMQPFAPTTAPFASDLRHLGLYYRQYERLMGHWHELLDIALLDVAYEDLTDDQETVSRQIIDFCGLEWDDACLSFHETKRQDRTLSYDQVRRPMYRSSVGRAARFGTHLDPLRVALAGGG